MIQGICIEYRQFGLELAEWKLYKYVSVHEDEINTNEIHLLRKAFGNFYEFRIVVQITEPITIKQYDRIKMEWREV